MHVQYIVYAVIIVVAAVYTVRAARELRGRWQVFYIGLMIVGALGIVKGAEIHVGWSAAAWCVGGVLVLAAAREIYDNHRATG